MGMLTLPHPSDLALLQYTGNKTSGNGAATLTHVESLTGLQNVGLVEFAKHLDVVTRHDKLVVCILSALGPVQRTRLIRSSDENLWPVVLAEASVTTTLLFAQDVHGDKELPVRLDLSRNADDHTAANVLALDATEQKTRIVTCARLLAGLLEGLDVGDLGLDGRSALTDELNFGVALQGAALDTARDDGTATSDGEDVLDSHEEGLLGFTLWGGNPRIDRLEQLVDLGNTNLRFAALDGAQSRTHDDGCLVALETVAAEQLAHLHLDELQHLRVVHRIHLVHEDDDLLHTDLAGEQQVLTGLGHLAVRRGDDDDGSVHVGGSRDHVLDVIGVTRAVDVGVVAGFGLVLDVGGGDGDTALALFGGLVDGAILEVLGEALLCLALGDGCGEGCL
jgi:hypothetical protein